MSKKILLIDDDKTIHELLGDYLRRNGFEVSSALDGVKGLELIKKIKFDILILDLMLPDTDGFEIMRKVRDFSDIPIIMLTANDNETDRIVGLEVGADDYLHKPLNPRELIARIKAVLRRTAGMKGRSPSQKDKSDELESRGLVINPAMRQVHLDGEEIPFSTVEFDILYALVSSKGRVISRDQLMNIARGRDFEAFDRSVDVHISRIRKKIENNPSRPKRIKTIWRKGYMWPED